jgi:predicted transglutaminase-like cysteine proteinase
MGSALRRLIVFLIVVGVLLLCIAPFTLMDQLRKFLSQVYDKVTNFSSQQETIEPKLEVSVKENSSYWETIGASDLPELISDVVLSVSNVGSVPAENVEVTTRIDGEVTNTLSVELLQPSETYSNSTTVHTSYNSARIVTVDASCSLSSATKTLIVNANLTRNFDKNLSHLFITPEDKSVVELKNKILKDKPIMTINWMALRDWVGANIQYRSDIEIHGKNDYWQFPNETIPLRTGDCEDFSTLLCSLLRADGWSPDRVYVIVGERNNQYHAWVRVTWNDLQYNIEPQGNGFVIAMGDVLSLSGYNAKYYFNDEKSGTFD